MPDVFLSYTHADRDKARLFAQALEAAGFDVWWDVTVRLGEAFDEATEAALRSAGAVVVLWSPKSVTSRWVRSEASVALRQGTLVPVMIETCERPVMFELTQTADLCHWDGDVAEPLFCRVAAQVRHLVRGEADLTPASSLAAPQGPARQAQGSGEEAPAVPAVPLERSEAVRLAVDRELQLPSTPSIALLPFTDMGSADDHFADGIVEELSTILSRFSSLMVIAGQSSLTYRNTAKTVQQISRELGVRYLLEGSVRRSGERVRIAVKLVDAPAGEQIWAERFDDQMDDIFDLQERVAKAIASAIDGTITDAEMRRATAQPPKSFDAYELTLRAAAMLAVYEREALDEAITLAERALEIDPNYGWAVAIIGFCLATQANNGWAEDPQEARRQALEIGERAMRLAGDDQRALATTAGLFATAADRTDRASRLIERALELNPEKAFTLYWAGWIDFVGGRFERGLARLERSLRLNPRSTYRPFQLQGLANCLFALERHTEAEAVAAEVDRIIPHHPPVNVIRIACLMLLGRETEARALYGAMSRRGSLKVGLGYYRVPPVSTRLREALAPLHDAGPSR